MRRRFGSAWRSDKVRYENVSAFSSCDLCFFGGATTSQGRPAAAGRRPLRCDLSDPWYKNRPCLARSPSYRGVVVSAGNSINTARRRLWWVQVCYFAGGSGSLHFRRYSQSGRLSWVKSGYSIYSFPDLSGRRYVVSRRTPGDIWYLGNSKLWWSRQAWVWLLPFYRSSRVCGHSRGSIGQSGRRNLWFSINRELARANSRAVFRAAWNRGSINIAAWFCEAGTAMTLNGSRCVISGRRFRLWAHFRLPGWKSRGKASHYPHVATVRIFYCQWTLLPQMWQLSARARKTAAGAPIRGTARIPLFALRDLGWQTNCKWSIRHRPRACPASKTAPLPALVALKLRPFQASNFSTTSPATSVSRKSRPE